GPGVTLIDAVTRALSPDLAYDVDGRLAARGHAVGDVVDDLLTHPYFASPPPKSTGRELFDQRYVESLIAKCRAARPACTTGDIVATATSLTARSMADAYRRFMPEPVTEILLSGGGAKNPTLVAMIEHEVAPTPVRAFSDRYFDGEA